MDGRSYDVIPQSIRSQRLTPEALSRHYVKSGTMIPLSTVVDINTQVEPNKLTQFNQQNAAIFQAIPAPGVTLGQAVAYLDNIANELPAGLAMTGNPIRANINKKETPSPLPLWRRSSYLLSLSGTI